MTPPANGPNRQTNNNEGDGAVAYVDGYLFALPKTEIEAYKEVARIAAGIWKEKGRSITSSAWPTMYPMANSPRFRGR